MLFEDSRLCSYSSCHWIVSKGDFPRYIHSLEPFSLKALSWKKEDILAPRSHHDAGRCDDAIAAIVHAAGGVELWQVPLVVDGGVPLGNAVSEPAAG